MVMEQLHILFCAFGRKPEYQLEKGNFYIVVKGNKRVLL